MSEVDGSLDAAPELPERFEVLDDLPSVPGVRLQRARDTLLDREVFLENAAPASDDPRLVAQLEERRLRQAQSLARLRQEGVQRLLDVIELPSGKLLVLEPIGGETLAGRLAREGHLAPGEVASIGAAIADVLADVHAAGVIHRGLHAGCITLGANDAVTLSGFHLAKPIAAPGSPSVVSLNMSPGPVSVSPHPAPEQILEGEEGPASDLFSLGWLLYEALTGTAPFAGLDVRRWEQPPDARDVVDGVPRDLSRILASCLSPSPLQRPASAEALASSLRSVRCAQEDDEPDAPPVVEAPEQPAAGRSLLDPPEALDASSRPPEPAARAPLAAAPAPLPTPTPNVTPTPSAAPVPATSTSSGSRHRWLWPAIASIALVIQLWLLFGGKSQGSEVSADRGPAVTFGPAASMDMAGIAAPTLQPRYAESHALLIGISDYGAVFPSLGNAERDVARLQDVLAHEHNARWEIRTLLGSEATRERIVDALTNLTRDAKPDDRLLVYFAGHGKRKEQANGVGWMIPADATEKPSSWVPFAELDQIFREEPGAKHILVAMDCCYGGRVAQMLPTRSVGMVGAFQERFLTRRAHIVIASGASDQQVSDGEPGQNSPFMQVIASLLEEPGEPLTASQLFAALQRSFAERGLPQIPLMGRSTLVNEDGGDFVFFRGAPR